MKRAWRRRSLAPRRGVATILAAAARLATEVDDKSLSYSVCCAVAAADNPARWFDAVASSLATWAAECLDDPSEEGLKTSRRALSLAVECLDAHLTHGHEET